MKHIRKRGVVSTMLVLLATFTGCGTDERVVQITQEADRRQEEANREIARVVNEETVFRQEAAKLQRDLRADQASIAQQRDQLEAERRQIASTREWAALYKPLLETIGIVLVVVATLAYCGCLIYSVRRDSGADHEVAELLVQQIVAPSALPPLPAPSRVLRLPAPRAEAAKAARN